MATIKMCTDIHQSKVLEKLLPLESADMHYSKDFDGSWFVDLAKYTSVKIPKYVGNIEEHLLPCWSLTALLCILPYPLLSELSNKIWKCVCYPSGICYYVTAYSPVDACVAMILKLNELDFQDKLKDFYMKGE